MEHKVINRSFDNASTGKLYSIRCICGVVLHGKTKEGAEVSYAIHVGNAKLRENGKES